VIGLSTSSRRVKLPVLVYVNSEAVGFGVLSYVDYYCDSLGELEEYRCYAHSVLVDTVEVGVFNMCFTDKLSSTRPGAKTRTLNYDVYVNNTKVGYAKIPVTDYAGKAHTYTEIMTRALQQASQVLYSVTLTTLLTIARKLREKTHMGGYRGG
jgi:hypothetical protein